MTSWTQNGADLPFFRTVREGPTQPALGSQVIPRRGVGGHARLTLLAVGQVILNALLAVGQVNLAA